MLEPKFSIKGKQLTLSENWGQGIMDGSFCHLVAGSVYRQVADQ
jgi:hypothetical protein